MKMLKRGYYIRMVALMLCLLLQLSFPCLCLSAFAEGSPLEAPRGITVTAADSFVALEWNYVAGAEGYVVDADGNIIDNGLDTAYLHEGLQENSLHSYRVGARDGEGNVSWSEAISQKTAKPDTAILQKWLPQSEMTLPGFGFGTAEVNGKIYIVGGYRDGICNTVKEYDTVSGVWTGKAGMPTARYGAGIIAVNGKIYAIGGYNKVSGTLDTVEEYDPVADTWTVRADMPTPRMRFGIAAVNGRIYAIGGYNQDMGTLNTVEEYDPVEDRWTAKARIPTPRSGLGAAQADGRIYAMGGFDGDYLDIIEEYDPIMDTWSKKGRLSMPASEFATMELNGRIFIIGGYNTIALDTVVEYNPAGNIFTSQANMLTGRYDSGAARIGEKLFVIGGSDDAKSLASIETAAFVKPDRPVSIAAAAGNENVAVTWGSARGAEEYDLQVDGVIIDNGENTVYLHDGILPNTQHDYRVRARNTAGAGEWSESASVIFWDNTGPGICVASVPPVPECRESECSEIVLKANNFSGLYTIQLELDYDPAVLEPEEGSITGLIWPEEEEVYFAVSVDRQNGRLKVLLSGMGDLQGKTGQFDILSVRFKALDSGTCHVGVVSISVVDSAGEPVALSQPPGLDVRIL